jgi:predicted dehydrogenase
MMEQPIRVAVVGCGWAGVRHAEAYERCEVTVGWAVDRDLRRAQALAGPRQGMHVATDYREALSDPDIGAISICLPHNLHAQVAVDAAQAGKHVLCEKPLAGSLEEADRMIEAAERTRVCLMVAENDRFDPLVRKVCELLKGGAIGEPALIQMTREANLARDFLNDRRWFLDSQAAAGGIMMSGGIHDFEKMRMLVGEIHSVCALRARQRFTEMEGDDTSVAIVQFESGAVGTLVESFVMKSLATVAGSEVHAIRIDGDMGSLCVQDGRTIRLFSEREDLRLREAYTQHEILVAGANTFALEVEHFLESIRMGREPLTSGRAQRRALEVVLAAYQSMESGGQPVKLA